MDKPLTRRELIHFLLIWSIGYSLAPWLARTLRLLGGLCVAIWWDWSHILGPMLEQPRAAWPAGQFWLITGCALVIGGGMLFTGILLCFPEGRQELRSQVCRKSR